MGNTTNTFSSFLCNRRVKFQKIVRIKAFGDAKVYEIESYHRQVVGIPCSLILTDPQKRIGALSFEKSGIFSNTQEEYLFYFNYAQISLDQVMEGRREQNQPFPEDDIIRIAREVLNCLQYLQSQNIAVGNIEPCTLFHDTVDNCIRLYDTSLILGENSAFQFVLSYLFPQDILKKNRIQRLPYVTPEILQALQLQPFKQYRAQQMQILSKYKYQIDIFSLGLTLLELSSFQDSRSLIDLRTGTILSGSLENRLNALCPRYSAKLQNLLREMLILDPIHRPLASKLLLSLDSSSVKPTSAPFHPNANKVTQISPKPVSQKIFSFPLFKNPLKQQRPSQQMNKTAYNQQESMNNLDSNASFEKQDFSEERKRANSFKFQSSINDNLQIQLPICQQQQQSSNKKAHFSQLNAQPQLKSQNQHCNEYPNIQSSCVSPKQYQHNDANSSQFEQQQLQLESQQKQIQQQPFFSKRERNKNSIDNIENWQHPQNSQNQFVNSYQGVQGYQENPSMLVTFAEISPRISQTSMKASPSQIDSKSPFKPYPSPQQANNTSPFTATPISSVNSKRAQSRMPICPIEIQRAESPIFHREDQSLSPNNQMQILKQPFGESYNRSQNQSPNCSFSSVSPSNHQIPPPPPLPQEGQNHHKLMPSQSAKSFIFPPNQKNEVGSPTSINLNRSGSQSNFVFAQNYLERPLSPSILQLSQNNSEFFGNQQSNNYYLSRGQGMTSNNTPRIIPQNQNVRPFVKPFNEIVNPISIGQQTSQNSNPSNDGRVSPSQRIENSFSRPQLAEITNHCHQIQPNILTNSQKQFSQSPTYQISKISKNKLTNQLEGENNLPLPLKRKIAQPPSSSYVAASRIQIAVPKKQQDEFNQNTPPPASQSMYPKPVKQRKPTIPKITVGPQTQNGFISPIVHNPMQNQQLQTAHNLSLLQDETNSSTNQYDFQSPKNTNLGSPSSSYFGNVMSPSLLGSINQYKKSSQFGSPRNFLHSPQQNFENLGYPTQIQQNYGFIDPSLNQQYAPKQYPQINLDQFQQLKQPITSPRFCLGRTQSFNQASSQLKPRPSIILEESDISRDSYISSMKNYNSKQKLSELLPFHNQKCDSSSFIQLDNNNNLLAQPQSYDHFSINSSPQHSSNIIPQHQMSNLFSFLDSTEGEKFGINNNFDSNRSQIQHQIYLRK